MKYIYLFISVLFIFSSCVDDPDVPGFTVNGKGAEVKTVSLSDITTNSVKIVGEVLKENGSKVTERGFCWKDIEPFDLEDALGKQKSGEGVSEYTETITGLIDTTEYFIRAYAVNAVDTTYGEILSFKTRAGGDRLPVVVTTKPTISNGSIIVGGVVTDEGSTQRVKDSGVCWSENPDPTLLTADTFSISSGKQSFSAPLGNLSGGTIYYVRAYARDIENRVSYGKEEKILTPEIFTDNAKFEGNLFIPGSAAFLMNMTKSNGYLLGGKSAATSINELWTFSPSSSDKWTSLQRYPLDRAWIAATSTQHGIFAYGGTDENGNPTNDFYQYNYNADMWSQMVVSGTEKPGPISHAAACFQNNYVYYIGGITTDSKIVSNEIWGIFATGNGSWEKRRALDEAQYSSIALLNEREAKLYVGLGKTNINSKISSRRFWSSTDNGNSWQEESRFPESNKSISAGVVHKNMIYVIDDQGYIWEYSTGSQTWKAKSKAPDSISGSVHCMYSIGDYIYIGLGSNNTIIKYDPVWDR